MRQGKHCTAEGLCLNPRWASSSLDSRKPTLEPWEIQRILLARVHQQSRLRRLQLAAAISAVRGSPDCRTGPADVFQSSGIWSESWDSPLQFSIIIITTTLLRGSSIPGMLMMQPAHHRTGEYVSFVALGRVVFRLCSTRCRSGMPGSKLLWQRLAVWNSAQKKLPGDSILRRYDLLDLDCIGLH